MRAASSPAGAAPVRAPDLSRRELVGLRVEVAASGDRGLRGLRGTVADETQRTLLVDTERGPRVVPKQGQQFTFTLPDGSLQTLEGEAIAFRPEDRIRKAPVSAARSSR